MSSINITQRVLATQALTKALNYKEYRDHAAASLWAQELVRLLQTFDIIREGDGAMTPERPANPTRIESALAALLDWGRMNTTHTDPNSPHDLLAEADRALSQRGVTPDKSDRMRLPVSAKDTLPIFTFETDDVGPDIECEVSVSKQRIGVVFKKLVVASAYAPTERWVARSGEKRRGGFHTRRDAATWLLAHHNGEA